MGLRDQPVHREVPAREGHVPGPESKGWTEVVSSITHVENPLVWSATLLRPTGHIVFDHHLLAHVDRAPLAVVRVEGLEHQTSVPVEGSWVGEDTVKKLAGADAPQPRLDEEGVGVRDQHNLKVLWRTGAEELEEVEHAGGGR